MRLKLLGRPRELLGKEVELDLGRTTLRKVLEVLPEEVRELVTDGKRLKMIVLINGVSAESKGGLDAEVGPEDEITIMPEVGGG
ncbi:MAG: MoaD/ThiS family protein [Candidatus Korarchaeota archaeon]|nr:MoaD/ThiS family protein [Candidatus Korarchaeota archaeon]